MFKARFDLKSKIYSFSIIIIIGIVSILILSEIKIEDFVSIIVLWFIIVGVILTPFLSKIKGYSINYKEIIIHKFYKSEIICIDDIIDIIQPDKETITHSYKIAGNAGFFGYIGIFSNSKYGTMNFYCSNLKNTVLIITKNKKILLSPNDCEKFIKQLKPN